MTSYVLVNLKYQANTIGIVGIKYSVRDLLFFRQ